MDKSRRYVLPVTITDADIEVLDSKRTAYFIFKGAALINVVANIEKMYFPIYWDTDVHSVNVVTVEALVRSNDWVAGRDNALSTVFGVEGEFLVRIGDADRPRDVCAYLLRQYYYKNGKDVTEHFSYEGCIVMCIESFLKQVPTKLIVETLEPVVLYMFPRDMLFKLAKENWEINMFYQKILEYSLIVSQIKADSWRFESARERYNLLLETHPEIIKRAPLAHIASYLLMTPETLSRVRSGVL